MPDNTPTVLGVDLGGLPILVMILGTAWLVLRAILQSLPPDREQDFYEPYPHVVLPAPEDGVDTFTVTAGDDHVRLRDALDTAGRLGVEPLEVFTLGYAETEPTERTSYTQI